MRNDITIVLSAADVKLIVEKRTLNQLMDDLIFQLTEEFKNFNPSKTIIPIRSGFNYSGDLPGLIEWMPIYETNKEVVLKVVGYHPKNPFKFNLPTILSTISSYDSKTGHLKGLVDGVLLTALRTGAASAVASKYMAHVDSSVLGLIGCGAQSITQLHAISRLFPINRILLFDNDLEAVNSFEKRCSILELEVDIEFTEIEALMSQSDIICTATSIDVGKGPLFESYSCKPHLHINAIGSDFPGKIELPLTLLRNSFVCPDFKEQAKKEGECQQLNDDEIGPDLVHVIQNNADYKQLSNILTVFDSTGLALEDKVVMDLFLDQAEYLGIGKKIGLENINEDVFNPYSGIRSKVFS
ncbi:ornithine cyclodeaminase family protein [Algibacter mikhailovii]|uniref:ornithine cyclodeaminase family protein n=1 Tax=Algibacter mikhailovii TaxID=425498 RepID=UPI0024951E54|nr:ornithine cyclodeaminase family protein [Algibacter mikhailovii]